MFSDESKARGYRMAGVLVDSADVARARRECSQWSAPGARRFHARKESNQRRLSTLSRLAGMSDAISLVIVEATPGAADAIVREHVLIALAKEATRHRVNRWLIERDDSALEVDQRALASFSRTMPEAKFEYIHMAGTGDPLLWAADLAVWAWTKGGSARAHIEPLVVSHIRL